MQNNCNSYSCVLYVVFMFISNVQYLYKSNKKINQRTSGPVNAHLTPGPGIYFNAFIHVYSPRQEQSTPWGQMLMSTESPYHCPFVASFKTISTRFFHVFPHVYSPGQGQTNPWCQNFNVNRKALSF